MTRSTAFALFFPGQGAGQFFQLFSSYGRLISVFVGDENCRVMTRGDGLLAIDDTIVPETGANPYSHIETALA